MRFADTVQVCVIAPDQLDEDGFLGVEVVIEAAREDARGVGDLLQRGTKTARRDDGVRRLEDLRAPRHIDRRLSVTAGISRRADPACPQGGCSSNSASRRRRRPSLTGPFPGVVGFDNWKEILPTDVRTAGMTQSEIALHEGASVRDAINGRG